MKTYVEMQWAALSAPPGNSTRKIIKVIKQNARSSKTIN